MNTTLLTDFYKLHMLQCYFKAGTHKRGAVFDLYFKENPCNNGFGVMAGLEQAVAHIKSLKFSKTDIQYLKETNLFDTEFLEYLKDFKFTGDIFSVPEGSVIFPNEPVLKIKAPLAQAQLLESILINIIGYQSLIATKASRIVWAAHGDKVLEFGLRYAKGTDAALFGSRSAIIGGCCATSNVLAGKMFSAELFGTQDYSFIMSFKDELSAFMEYAKLCGDTCVLLVDTYDTLKSGIPNAIKVFKKLKNDGKLPKCYGIKIDSGDFSYVSAEARRILDDEGFEAAVICASGSLDENIIASLKQQGAKIDFWGVGRSLITSADYPSVKCVYSLCCEQDEKGAMQPKLKFSENASRITTPGDKKVFRIYDINTNKIKADIVALENETIDTEKNLTIFDPLATWKTMTLKAGRFNVRELLKPVFLNGKCIYKKKKTEDIQAYAASEKATLWPEYKRLVNPHVLPVDLSNELYELKNKMIEREISLR